MATYTGVQFFRGHGVDAIFKLKMPKNAFMARALPQTTPLGELLQHSPNFLAGLMKDRSWPTGVESTGIPGKVAC